MIFSHVGELRKHIYCWVDSTFTHKEPCGFIKCVWFGLVAYPGRVWGCTVMLESGAVYRNLPPHALAFGTLNKVPDGWSEDDAQFWNCYGYDFSVIEYSFLHDLVCLFPYGISQLMGGTYLFTVAPIGDGYSAAPEQAKEFVFIKLDNGRLTIQPTDRVIFEDKSFTDGKMMFPTGLRRQYETYKVE